MSKSCNLEKLCLQMNSSWQYIDQKLNGTLSSITTAQKIPKDTITLTDEQHLALADKMCTIYTVVRDASQTSHKTSSIKNFCVNYTKESLNTTEKENIYWKLRLRYGCGIIPVAVACMEKKLRRKKYTNWLLPNGTTVSSLQRGNWENYKNCNFLDSLQRLVTLNVSRSTE